LPDLFLYEWPNSAQVGQRSVLRRNVKHLFWPQEGGSRGSTKRA